MNYGEAVQARMFSTWPDTATEIFRTCFPEQRLRGGGQGPAGFAHCWRRNRRRWERFAGISFATGERAIAVILARR